MTINIFLLLFLLLCIILSITGVVHLMNGVPYVPTSMRVVRRMIEIAKLKKGEKVFDLGCGDGRLLYESEKHTKVPATGYEMAPAPYIIALISRWFHKSKAELHMKSLFSADISQADVIFCYLMPHMLKKLSHKLKSECKPGARVVSHGFKIEGLDPKQKFQGSRETRLPTIYLYEF